LYNKNQIREIKGPLLGNARVPPRVLVHGLNQGAGELTTTRNKTAFPDANNRSRITNGRDLLPGVHKQSVWARRFRDVIGLYASDQGGDDSLSEARRSIIRRVACLQTELELLETRFALAGGAEPSDLDLYQRTSANLRRLLECIGIDRVPRDITTLGDILSEGNRADG
jgi:hypothetical protein